MENEKTKPLAVVETRVSDPRQGDGTHKLQTDECLLLAGKLGVQVERDAVWNVTISGSKETRDSFEEILEYIESKKGRVKYYICYSIERFTRAGPSVYETMKNELRRRGVDIRDVEGVIQPDKNSMENLGFEYEWSKYSPSDTNELLEAGKGRDNKRKMLTRMIGQEIINANEGYAVHPAPDGYTSVTESYFADGKRKKRTTRKIDTSRAHFYKKMFELRAGGSMTDEQIVSEINDMGYSSKVRVRWNKGRTEKMGNSGGIPLSVKQLQFIIQRPAYAAVNYEKWTHLKAIRSQWSGIVSIGIWNKANRGRWYIEEKPDGSLAMHQNYDPEERTHDNPLYPYKDVVLCSVCKKPFRGSASRSKSGKHIPAYHCERKIDGVKHKRVSGNKWQFETKVEEFVHNLRFHPELLESFKLVLRDIYSQKQAGAIAAATEASKRVTALQEQKAAAVQAYIAANKEGDGGLMRDLKAERARIDDQLQIAQGYRDSLEVSERDLDDFLFRLEWVMEHPAEFLLRAKNKPQRQAYFSLIFEELPTYQDVIDGTPKLAWVFKLDETLNTNESDNVRRGGFEPP